MLSRLLNRNGYFTSEIDILQGEMVYAHFHLEEDIEIEQGEMNRYHLIL